MPSYTGCEVRNISVIRRASAPLYEPASLYCRTEWGWRSQLGVVEFGVRNFDTATVGGRTVEAARDCALRNK